jgi:hypothetical protein
MRSVIRGKVEEISLPDDIEHVDIIVSEWMGYALLYESMLDSVLHARDRFLKPEGGVMAPSQCRIMFGLCEGKEIFKERIGFWNDVYGAHLILSYLINVSNEIDVYTYTPQVSIYRSWHMTSTMKPSSTSLRPRQWQANLFS